MGKIIYYPRLYHPAGFRQRADTRFLVVHPQNTLNALSITSSRLVIISDYPLLCFFCEGVLFILKFLR